jgi:hypothetical protein
MKRFATCLVSAITAAVFLTPVSAATFTDFDSYTSFEAGGNTVFNFEDPGDYWVGEWNGGGENGNTISISIVDGKGFGGSKALALSEDGDSNVGVYLNSTSTNKIATNYSGAEYLRVWCDFTDVGFRKMNYGITNSSYSRFTTDEVDTNWQCDFYYLADGSTEWVTMTHGDDGCFGDAQNSDVYGFKGWFAFPLKDFVVGSGANWDGLDVLTPCDPTDITGVYIFWDYSDTSTAVGSVFYLDNLEFVADYKTDLPTAGQTQATDVATTETAVSTDTAEQTETVVDTAAPQTLDPISLCVTSATLAIAGIVLIKKKDNH